MGRNKKLSGLGTHHTSLHVRDLDASLRIYRDVLGLEETARMETNSGILVLLDIGDGTHLELFAPRDPSNAEPTSERPWRHLALKVDDARQAVETLRNAGVTIVVEPRDIQFGPVEATIAFFQGPDGERVEFFQVGN